MRALALALVVAISVPGCAMTSQQKRVGYGAGAVAMAIGVAALVALLQPCRDGDLIEAAGCGVAKIELYTAGLLFGGAGVATLAVTAGSPSLDAPDAETRPATEAAEPQALVVPDPTQAAPPANLSIHELTQQASTAARIGQCGTVTSIADRVELLDPTYRFKEFVSDAAIAGCLY